MLPSRVFRGGKASTLYRLAQSPQQHQQTVVSSTQRYTRLYSNEGSPAQKPDQLDDRRPANPYLSSSNFRLAQHQQKQFSTVTNSAAVNVPTRPPRRYPIVPAELLIDQFVKSLASEDPQKAVQKYQHIRSENLVTSISADDIQSYIMLLCGQLHSRSPKYSLPSRSLYIMVESALQDLTGPLHGVLKAELYPVLLKFFVSTGRYSRAIEMFDEMKTKHVSVSAGAYASMILCFEKLGEPRKAMALFEEMAGDLGSSLGSGYDHCLVMRSMIRIYGQMNDLDKAEELKIKLLENYSGDNLPAVVFNESNQVALKTTNNPGIGRIYLAYLDACTEAKDYDRFSKALTELETMGPLDSTSYGHVMLNLTKLNRFDEMLKYLELHHRAVVHQTSSLIQGDPLTVHKSDSFADAMERLVQHAVEQRDKLLSPSAFADILFSLGRNIVSNPTNEMQKEVNQLTLTIANEVFGKYRSQIVATFDRLHEIARDISTRSFQQVIATSKNPALFGGPICRNDNKVVHIPRQRLYTILMRSNNPFVALAKLYQKAGETDKALDILEESVKYHAYGEAQLRNIFGQDAMEIPRVKEIHGQSAAMASKST